MDIMQMLEIFKDPNTIHSLSLGDKMSVTLLVAGLGMGITFAALILIWGCIATMSKIILSRENSENKPVEKLSVAKSAPVTQSQENVSNEENEELIAVIAAAIAASLNTSIHNIIVKNIVQVSDSTPSWGRAGRMEQMNTRF